MLASAIIVISLILLFNVARAVDRSRNRQAGHLRNQVDVPAPTVHGQPNVHGADSSDFIVGGFHDTFYDDFVKPNDDGSDWPS